MAFTLLIVLNLFLAFQIFTLKRKLQHFLQEEKNKAQEVETLFSNFSTSLERATREQNYLFCKFLDDKLYDFKKDFRQKETQVITKGYENPLESELDHPK